MYLILNTYTMNTVLIGNKIDALGYHTYGSNSFYSAVESVEYAIAYCNISEESKQAYLKELEEAVEYCRENK